MSSEFIYVAASISIHFFLQWSNIPLYHLTTLYLFTSWCIFELFPHLATLNSAVMNISAVMDKYLRGCFQFFWISIYKNGTIQSYGNLCLICWGTAKLFYTVALYFPFLPAGWGSSFSASLPTLLFSVLFFVLFSVCLPSGYEVVSHCDSGLHSLMTNDVPYLFLCFLGIGVHATIWTNLETLS